MPTSCLRKAERRRPRLLCGTRIAQHSERPCAPWKAPAMPGVFHDRPDARRLRPKLTDTWHSDERVGCTGGAPVSLRRTLNSQGEVLDLLIPTGRTRHRDKHLGGWINAVSDPY